MYLHESLDTYVMELHSYYMFIVYYVYLGYFLNIICIWHCSIHFTTWFAACILHAYVICYMLCTMIGTHASACMSTVLCMHVWCVCVLASDSSAQASRVQVAIQTLDENDSWLSPMILSCVILQPLAR
jgi:hypothetical protein